MGDGPSARQRREGAASEQAGDSLIFAAGQDFAADLPGVAGPSPATGRDDLSEPLDGREVLLAEWLDLAAPILLVQTG